MVREGVRFYRDMDTNIEQALLRGGIVDVTTTGRKTGQARRIEIYLHNLDGELYLTGKPGFPRDWIANLRADPRLTLHLKGGVAADLPGTAEVVTDPEEKARIILRARVESWGANPDQARADIDHWVATSPLARVSLTADS
jgi:deazaflavin-dependent oxidoreductase (nitroreductase family)